VRFQIPRRLCYQSNFDVSRPSAARLDAALSAHFVSRDTQRSEGVR
jgi:hypothetical protein